MSEPASTEPYARPAPDWLTPAIIGTAFLLQTLMSTVLANALPSMSVALGVNPLRLNMAITMYLLASAVFLPVSGWAGDRFGARLVFVTAIILFGISSSACGFSQNLPQLIVARIFQGMAAAMMTPVGRLVLLRTTPKDRLVGAMSILTVPPLLGTMIGPVLGGAIVTYLDWRWIFFINLPVAVMGVILVLRHIPKVEPLGAPKLDWFGVALTGLGLACLVFGFENLGHPIIPLPAVAALFVIGAGSLWLYARYAHGNPRAILDLSLFDAMTFRAAVVGGSFMRFSISALPFLLALLFQIGFGMDALQAGLLTFYGGAGALVMKASAPPILRRFGFRTVLLVNGFLVAVMSMAYAFIQPGTPQWLIIAVLLIGGFFRSLQFTSLNGMVYADVDQPQMSRASTLSSMAQQLSQSVGAGLAALMLHWVMAFQGVSKIDVHVVAPVMFAFGVISLISLLYFWRLDRDAGDGMNGRTALAAT